MNTRVRAEPSDDATDERAMPGLVVEPAETVIIGLVLVIPASGGPAVEPRLVHNAVRQLGMLGSTVAGTQACVQDNDIGSAVARQRERCTDAPRRRRTGRRRRRDLLGARLAAKTSR